MLFSVPSASYNAGVTNFGPFNLPNQVFTRARMTLTRNAWPLTENDLLIDLLMEISYDNGGSWMLLGFFRAYGGSPINARTGLPYTVSTANVPIPFPTNNQSRVRLILTAAAAFTTAVEVELT